MTTVIVISVYLGLLLGLALFSKTLFRGTSKDYFVASHSIGPFMLLMSVFGTTMTAFALVGSTGKAFGTGIGTYGLMASSSGLIHAACFFLIGIKLWAIGKRYGYVTQIQYFRARFESKAFGYLLFPILVLLVIPYLLIGVVGAAKTIEGVTKMKAKPNGEIISPGVFPEWTDNAAIPPWFTGLVICIVVLTYIFAGGSRAAAWANTFQTIVFMIMGVLAFYLISDELKGVAAATEQALDTHKVRTVEGKVGVSQLTFLTYMFIPLSVGMFPHLFQHWLTARSAKSFKLTVIAHPICIMIVWVPCVLIGIWASGQLSANTNPAIVLSVMVSKLVGDPLIVGLVTAGVLAAIMSSLDSQFLCLGTMFTNDIVLHESKKTYSDKQTLLMARGFIVGIVIVIYLISLVLLQQEKQFIFGLAVWSFSGFAALTPLVIASLYWKRATRTGAYACVTCVFISWIIFFSMSGFGGELHILGGVTPAAIMWFIGAAAMIIGSLLSEPPKEETIKKFF
ncbi:MAG: sodium:solute symporter family protein [Akkermansiaceae bacterium]